MPAKRCVETKNMCLLFVDYCKNENNTRPSGVHRVLEKENENNTRPTGLNKGMDKEN